MKKLLATVAAACLATATTASAEDYATITSVKPNYQTVQTPKHRTDCRTNEVPIYGSTQGQASTGDTLFGALIGGALGNQVGGGKGKDAATVLGAIIGADIANKKGGRQQIIGYRQEQTCNNVTFYETNEGNGIQGRTVTYNNYRVGDSIPIYVSIQAK